MSDSTVKHDVENNNVGEKLEKKIDAGRKKQLKSALINYALKKNKGQWYHL